MVDICIVGLFSKPRLAESDIRTFCRPYRRSPRTRVFIRRSARSLQAKADASQHGIATKQSLTS